MSSFAWSVLVWSVSCSKQSANMLNRFWIGIFGLFSIPALIVAVSLDSEIDVDLDLRLIVIGCRTYSVAFLLALGHASELVAFVL